MIVDYPCPVCQATAWQPVQDFVYDARDQTANVPAYRHYWQRLRHYLGLLWFDAPYPHTVSAPPLSAAQRLRRRVLFECWFPGTETIKLTSVLCRECGLMTYTPRPTQGDLQAKYAFLAQEHGDHDATTEMHDLERAQRVYNVIAPHFPNSSPPLTVLDYGGGDGRLMQPFLQRGDHCFLVDYATDIRPGVVKLGDELGAVPADKVFDVVICSHVLEHLADPLEIVQQLRVRLKPDGVMYAEVPQEIWDGIRIEYDPVTHVNFFTRYALEWLFLRAGYTILVSRKIAGSYGQARKEVIWLLAQPGVGVGAGMTRPAVSPEKSLRPGRLRSLRRLWQQYAPTRLRGK
ncbi:MAG: class I SAM-dependent methyltransferase [Anaerolineae bacterium]|nr:class I SAM-dependent methyltransferase [Anaerolineae bacterium]